MFERSLVGNLSRFSQFYQIDIAHGGALVLLSTQLRWLRTATGTAPGIRVEIAVKTDVPTNVAAEQAACRRLVSRIVGSALLVLLSMVCCGCTRGPYMGASPWQNNQAMAAAADPAAAQIAELNRRVRLLDDNNRQLHTQLAQSEQQALVYRDELGLVRQQLADTASKLDSAMLAANDASQKFQGLQASTQARGGAVLQANTNLKLLAGQLSASGLTVVPDGETLRILLPGDQLFQPGSATLEPTSAALLDAATAQIRTLLPRQKIAIEGYTDNSPLYGGRFANSHQLSSAQAGAVMEMLIRRGGLPEAQFFIVAQGTNHPRADNGSPQGRAQNRRVELVVYPNTF